MERAIEKSSPACVYLTSPDYLGHMTEIDGIAEICHKHGVMLLVDHIRKEREEKAKKQDAADTDKE